MGASVPKGAGVRNPAVRGRTISAGLCALFRPCRAVSARSVASQVAGAFEGLGGYLN